MLQQKRYSKSTIKTYTSYFSQFQEYFNNQDLESISVGQINFYIMELINLKVEDIDSKRKLIKIRAAKGKKDRYTLLSDKLIELLRIYYRTYWPREWLFEGQNGGQYSATSVAKIVKAAVNKAGIHKHVTPHSLRHSFATHLLEQGTNLRYIKEILGHEDPKTTQIYTRVATKEIRNIRSPMDDID